MRGLTLTQPWATLLALGEKQIETRSWRTSYRGDVAIHAGQGLGPVGGMAGLRDQVMMPPFCGVLLRRCYDIIVSPHFSGDRAMVTADPGLVLPRGCIVAVAELVDCRPTAGSIGYARDGDGAIIAVTEQEHAFGDYAPGRYAWLLDGIRPLRTPLPWKGAQGLWYVPDLLELAIEDCL